MREFTRFVGRGRKLWREKWIWLSKSLIYSVWMDLSCCWKQLYFYQNCSFTHSLISLYFLFLLIMPSWPFCNPPNLMNMCISFPWGKFSTVTGIYLNKIIYSLDGSLAPCDGCACCRSPDGQASDCEFSCKASSSGF